MHTNILERVLFTHKRISLLIENRAYVWTKFNKKICSQCDVIPTLHWSAPNRQVSLHHELIKKSIKQASTSTHACYVGLNLRADKEKASQFLPIWCWLIYRSGNKFKIYRYLLLSVSTIIWLFTVFMIAWQPDLCCTSTLNFLKVQILITAKCVVLENTAICNNLLVKNAIQYTFKISVSGVYM